MHADERRERLERNAAAQAARARPTAAVADERKRPRSPDEHRGAAAGVVRHNYDDSPDSDSDEESATAAAKARARRKLAGKRRGRSGMFV